MKLYIEMVSINSHDIYQISGPARTPLCEIPKSAHAALLQCCRTLLSAENCFALVVQHIVSKPNPGMPGGAQPKDSQSYWPHCRDISVRCVQSCLNIVVLRSATHISFNGYAQIKPPRSEGLHHC